MKEKEVPKKPSPYRKFYPQGFLTYFAPSNDICLNLNLFYFNDLLLKIDRYTGRSKLEFNGNRTVCFLYTEGEFKNKKVNCTIYDKLEQYEGRARAYRLNRSTLIIPDITLEYESRELILEEDQEFQLVSPSNLEKIGKTFEKFLYTGFVEEGYNFERGKRILFNLIGTPNVKDLAKKEYLSVIDAFDYNFKLELEGLAYPPEDFVIRDSELPNPVISNPEEVWTKIKELRKISKKEKKIISLKNIQK